jgi:hypothetical protein
MSLEQHLAENTAAIKELTAAVLAGNESRAAVLETAKKVTEKAAPAKAAAKPAEKPAEKPAAEKPAAEAGDDASAIQGVKDAVLGYVGATDRAEEREARKAKVKEIFGKVGATNATDVPTDKRQAFINTMNKLTEQGDITEAPAEEAGSADDDLLGDD